MNQNRLEKAGSYQFHIESYVCDFTEKATLPVVCNFILDAASIHAQQRGFGYEQISKDGVAWVLSRLSIEMNEYPAQNQDFTVETWVENVSRVFTQRCFRFIGERGTVLGYARSIWAAIDVGTRKPIDIPAWRPDMLVFIALDKPCPVSPMDRIPPVEDVEPTIGYTVRYSDIDINKHMNSVKYVEHALNVFDLDIFKEKIIHKFEIVYLAEGHYGDKLKVYKEDISDNESLIDTKEGDDSLCRIRITWK
jgi:acyl-ACP thioesterase